MKQLIIIVSLFFIIFFSITFSSSQKNVQADYSECRFHSSWTFTEVIKTAKEENCNKIYWKGSYYKGYSSHNIDVLKITDGNGNDITHLYHCRMVVNRMLCTARPVPVYFPAIPRVTAKSVIEPHREPTLTPKIITPTQTPEPTEIIIPTKTIVPTNTPRPTDVPAPTSTIMPTVPSPTLQPTNTVVPNTPTPTKTKEPTPTPTVVIIPTNTPIPTVLPTKTSTPTSTPTMTSTPVPTATLVPYIPPPTPRCPSDYKHTHDGQEHWHQWSRNWNGECLHYVGHNGIGYHEH